MPAYDKLEAETLPAIIYPEHDTAYLQECLDNLKAKRNLHLKEENDAFI